MYPSVVLYAHLPKNTCIFQMDYKDTQGCSAFHNNGGKANTSNEGQGCWLMFSGEGWI